MRGREMEEEEEEEEKGRRRCTAGEVGDMLPRRAERSASVVCYIIRRYGIKHYLYL
jgi:hypothetical protein